MSFPDRLETMLATQRAFQLRLNGYDVDDQSDPSRIENFKISLLALEDELHEALNEMGWKEWAKSRHFNEQRVREELIDAWHFFMNLMLHAGMTADMLFDMYRAKHAVNVKRQDDGYDGVSNKCPACHRDLNEDPPRMLKIVLNSGTVVETHACVCGQSL